VSVRRAPRHIDARSDIEIFLQGSYANSFNIRADSDVNVVVMSIRSFQGSLERLGPSAQTAWNNLPPATYTAADLRSEVMAALVAHSDRAGYTVATSAAQWTRRPATSMLTWCPASSTAGTWCELLVPSSTRTATHNAATTTRDST
jgi:hypothetical protein